MEQKPKIRFILCGSSARKLRHGDSNLLGGRALQKNMSPLLPRELGSESLKNAAEEMLSATSGQVTYEFDNGTKTTVYTTSPLTQWRFAIATSDVSAE